MYLTTNTACIDTSGYSHNTQLQAHTAQEQVCTFTIIQRRLIITSRELEIHVMFSGYLAMECKSFIISELNFARQM